MNEQIMTWAAQYIISALTMQCVHVQSSYHRMCIVILHDLKGKVTWFSFSMTNLQEKSDIS